MNTSVPAMTNRMPHRSTRIRGISALLMAIIVAKSVTACDICLRMPRVPFQFDQPAALDVVMATRAAAEAGELILNPEVRLTAPAGFTRTVHLSELSARQLITQWIKTRPAAACPSLRCSVELVFVDVDSVSQIDIRFGEILEGQGTGPADIRLFTTKAGFCRLVDDGLAACEERQLVGVEPTRESFMAEQLRSVFTTRSTLSRLATNGHEAASRGVRPGG